VLQQRPVYHKEGGGQGRCPDGCDTSTQHCNKNGVHQKKEVGNRMCVVGERDQGLQRAVRVWSWRVGHTKLSQYSLT
jgi:hypothetical protein